MSIMPLEEALPYRTEPLADGVRFVLPRRRGQAGGICLILFGMFFSGFAVFWSLGAMGVLDDAIDHVTGGAAPKPQTTPAPAPPESGPEPEPQGPEPAGPTTPIANDERTAEAPAKSTDEGGFDICRVAFGLFGVPFFLAGLVPITVGIMSIFGHTEVELTSDHLYAFDRAGPVRLGKRKPIGQVTGFEIGPAVTPKSSSSGNANAVFAQYAIHAQFGQEAPVSIARGYPLPTLRQLAGDLATEQSRITGKGRLPVKEALTEASSGEASSDGGGDAPPETVPPQPIDSKVIVERVRSGLTLRVPPTGFRKGSFGLLMFGLFWCGMVGIITAAMFAAGVPLEMLLFISIFWAVGISVLIGSLSLARRQAVIDVVHDTLLVTRQGLFKRSQHEWRAEELADIRVDHSGMSVNNKPVLNLQIIPREGKTIGLFTGRDETELHWLAAELRVAMGLRRKA